MRIRTQALADKPNISWMPVWTPSGGIDHLGPRSLYPNPSEFPGVEADRAGCIAGRFAARAHLVREAALLCPDMCQDCSSGIIDALGKC